MTLCNNLSRKRGVGVFSRDYGIAKPSTHMVAIVTHLPCSCRDVPTGGGHSYTPCLCHSWAGSLGARPAAQQGPGQRVPLWQEGGRGDAYVVQWLNEVNWVRY